jgi:hypothetical protein
MFRSLLPRAALGALLIGAWALPALASPILPGWWESTDTITSPIQQTKTSRKCITAVNNHYACHYKDKKMGGGTFSMAGDCVDNNGIPAKISVSGVYTDTSFTMNGRLRIIIGGLPIPVSASTDAHRISADCPAPVSTAPPDPAPVAPAESAAPPAP